MAHVLLLMPIVEFLPLVGIKRFVLHSLRCSSLSPLHLLIFTAREGSVLGSVLLEFDWHDVVECSHRPLCLIIELVPRLSKALLSAL